MFGIDKFSNFVQSLEVQQLQAYLIIINDEISKKLSRSYVNKTPLPTSSVSDDGIEKSANSVTKVGEYNPSVYSATELVEYEAGFLSTAERDTLNQECESLGFNKYTKSDAVQNKFLSPYSEPYIWDSVNGPVVNKAIGIDNFPVVKDILAKVNSKFECELNCVLIAYYKNGSVNCRLHRDNETSLDPSQPIVVVSVGAKRRVEFLDNNRASWMASNVILDPEDCSIYIMHSGCQNNCRHRVRMNKRVRHERISFSFRAFVPSDRRSFPNPALPLSTPTSSYKPPVPNATTHNALAKVLNFNTPNILDTPKTSLNLSSTQNLPTNKFKQSVDMQLPKQPGFSPFSTNTKGVSFQSTSSEFSQHTGAKTKYCILFGTSITTDINESLMSKRNHRFINCSTSGANIHDISKLAQDFYHENTSINNQIDKVIISVGTNDIKYFNGKEHDVNSRFRPQLINLVKSLKYMYPYAQIIFQCVLPIQVIRKYTATTVEQFNDLLFYVCERYGCIYFDQFFDNYIDGWDYNKRLYRDSFHLNENGLRLLCRYYKRIIHQNVHNPYPRICFSHRPYTFY